MPVKLLKNGKVKMTITMATRKLKNASKKASKKNCNPICSEVAPDIFFMPITFPPSACLARVRFAKFKTETNSMSKAIAINPATTRESLFTDNSCKQLEDK